MLGILIDHPRLVCGAMILVTVLLATWYTVASADKGERDDR